MGLISQMILRCHRAKFSSHLSTWLFDTWCGIPEAQIGLNEPLARWHNSNNYCEDTFSFVTEIFSSFANVQLVKGEVSGTLAAFREEVGCLTMLHLDMNVVIPEKAALEFFWPKLSAGGVVLLLDDYGFAKHTEQRFFYDEFFGALNLIPCQLPTGQAFVLKNRTL